MVQGSIATATAQQQQIELNEHFRSIKEWIFLPAEPMVDVHFTFQIC
jgi:hypothetical protein